MDFMDITDETTDQMFSFITFIYIFIYYIFTSVDKTMVKLIYTLTIQYTQCKWLIQFLFLTSEMQLLLCSNFYCLRSDLILLRKIRNFLKAMKESLSTYLLSGVLAATI